MYFSRAIFMSLVFLLGLISVVLSSPAANSVAAHDTPSPIKREEPLNILVAKEYPSATTYWNNTSVNETSTLIPAFAPVNTSVPATSGGVEVLKSSLIVTAMTVGWIVFNLL